MKKKKKHKTIRGQNARNACIMQKEKKNATPCLIMTCYATPSCSSSAFFFFFFFLTLHHSFGTPVQAGGQPISFAVYLVRCVNFPVGMHMVNNVFMFFFLFHLFQAENQQNPLQRTILHASSTRQECKFLLLNSSDTMYRFSIFVV